MLFLVIAFTVTIATMPGLEIPKGLVITTVAISIVLVAWVTAVARNIRTAK